MRYGSTLKYDESMKLHEEYDPIGFNEHVNRRVVEKLIEGASEDLFKCIKNTFPNYELGNIREKKLELEIFTREQSEMILRIVHSMKFGDTDKEEAEEKIRNIFSQSVRTENIL